MSDHRIEQPVIREEGGPVGGTVASHPCFAQIQANRVSSTGETLYDSEFRHHHFIRVSIRRSTLHRSLANDQTMAGDELILVALSEAQWASFISSLNIGEGTPCTMQRLGGKLVPGLPIPSKSTEKFSDDLKKTLGEIQDEIQQISQALTDGAIGKTRARELQKRLDHAAHRLTGSTGFVADMFDEHMEGTVEKARVEVNAYATAVVQRAGLQALSQGAPLTLDYASDAAGLNPAPSAGDPSKAS